MRIIFSLKQNTFENKWFTYYYLHESCLFNSESELKEPKTRQMSVSETHSKPLIKGVAVNGNKASWGAGLPLQVSQWYRCPASTGERLRFLIRVDSRRSAALVVLVGCWWKSKRLSWYLQLSDIPLFSFLVWYLIMPRNRAYILQKRNKKENKRVCVLNWLMSLGWLFTFCPSPSFHQLSVQQRQCRPCWPSWLPGIFLWDAARKGILHYHV